MALPDVEEIEPTMGRERSGELHRDPVSGEELAHSGWYDAWDPATHTLGFTLRILSRNGAGPPRETLRPHRVHLFTPDELTGLLAEAGLEQVAVAGGFGGAPLSRGSEIQVYRCRAVA